MIFFLRCWWNVNGLKFLKNPSREKKNEEKRTFVVEFVWELIGLMTFFLLRWIDGEIDVDDFLLMVPSLKVGHFLMVIGLSLVVVVVVVGVVVVTVDVVVVVVGTAAFGIVKRSGGWLFCCWSFSTFSYLTKKENDFDMKRKKKKWTFSKSFLVFSALALAYSISRILRGR